MKYVATFQMLFYVIMNFQKNYFVFPCYDRPLLYRNDNHTLCIDTICSPHQYVPF